jgi:hypothetical protein
VDGRQPTQYAGKELQYLSDMTDAELAVLKPYSAEPSRHARPRKGTVRVVIVDLVLYILRPDLPWRMLSENFSLVSTVL